MIKEKSKYDKYKYFKNIDLKIALDQNTSFYKLIVKVKKEIVETLKNQSQKSNTQMMKYSITTDSSDSILLDMLQSNKNL